MTRGGVTAVIPIRLGLPRKTRLTERLSPGGREMLADQLFRHVADVVSAHPSVSRTVVLSPVCPPAHPGEWRADLGRGLNAELESLRAELSIDDLLVIHGDLPLLRDEDVGAMIGAAQPTGVALAPDHAETGTNAVALKPQIRFSFAFGPASLAAHVAASAGKACMVRRVGLAFDIDEPADLDAAEQAGFVWQAA